MVNVQNQISHFSSFHLCYLNKKEKFNFQKLIILDQGNKICE